MTKRCRIIWKSSPKAISSLKTCKIKENIQNPNTDTLLESYKFRLLWLYFNLKIHNIIIKSLKTNSCNLDTIYDLQHWLFSVKQEMQKKIQKTTNQASGGAASTNSMLESIPKTGWPKK